MKLLNEVQDRVFKGVGAAIALLTFAAITSLAQNCPPERILTFGASGNEPGNFNVAAAVAADAQGNIYVTDFFGNRVEKFNRDGKFLLAWGSLGTGNGQFNGPNFLAVDSAGNIFVTEYLNCRVQKFTPDGKFLMSFGSEGDGPGQFFGATGIALDASGNIYVCDQGNYRVQKFTSNGTFILAWGTHGGGNGEFRYATDVEINSKGIVYVLDATDVDFTPNDRIQTFDQNGNFIATWGSHGSGNGQFDFPLGLGIDSQDRVYVADYLNYRVQLFDASGNFILSRGTNGSAAGEFNGPDAVAIDNAGNVIVSEDVNNRVQVFRGFTAPCPVSCNSGVCYSDPQTWAIAIQNNPGQFTNSFVSVPGDNFGQPVRVVWNSGFGLQPAIGILLTLSDGIGRKSTADQLLGRYIAAQLSLQRDLPFSYNQLTRQQLACQLATTIPAIGLPPPPVLLVSLSTGITLTQASNLQDLFDATDKALKTNNAADQTTLLAVYRQLRTCRF